MENPTILFIEDNHALQELYQLQFSKANFTVLQAFDGQEGLNMVRAHPEIKVILVDIMLPKLSGYEVVANIRTEALTKDIPIMIVSALDDQGDREKGLAIGANEYITKGQVSLHDLIDKVKRYF
jgi:DNA-binding response OmpR family regulator